MSLRCLSSNRWRNTVLAMAAGALVHAAAGQDTPLISGGAGFITSTKGGNTTYIPVIAPVLAAPLGNHVLVESRATILQSWFPKGGQQSGYQRDTFLGLDFLQADILAGRHTTIVAGQFLIPFATYNERLSPIWISNFE